MNRPKTSVLFLHRKIKSLFLSSFYWTFRWKKTLTLKNKNKILVGGNSLWLYWYSWVDMWMCAQIHMLSCTPHCFNKFQLTLLSVSDLKCICFCFFQTTCFFKQFVFSKRFSLPWLASCHQEPVLADSDFSFLLIACIHTEIETFCICLSMCACIICLRKEVETVYFHFETLHLEIYFLPASVIENCLSGFYYFFSIM